MIPTEKVLVKLDRIRRLADDSSFAETPIADAIKEIADLISILAHEEHRS